MAILLDVDKVEGEYTLPDIQRPNFTINATITAEDDEGGTVTNVTARLLGTTAKSSQVLVEDNPGSDDDVYEAQIENVELEDPKVVITDGETSVTLTGEVADPFIDVFYWVNKGESDKTDTVKSAIGKDNVPPNKELFKLDQDTTDKYVREIEVTVTYEDALTFEEKTEVITVYQPVLNEYEDIRQFMANYYR